MSLVFWIVAGVLLTILVAGITLIWWWVGDQWADDEYKKFGHGGGAKPAAGTTQVIRDNPHDGAHEPKVIEGSTHE